MESSLKFGGQTSLSSGNKDETHEDEGKTGGARGAPAGHDESRRREKREFQLLF